MDDLDSHRRFTDKYELNYTLGSDSDGTASKAYGVMQTKSMFGNTSQGIERSTFLIDGSGTICGVWRKVDVNGHADAIRKTLQSLGTSANTRQAA